MSSFTDLKRNSQPNTSPESEGKEGQIKVDGYGQVIALLEVADPSFRESLLNRIAAKDPSLARQIRATLARN